MSIRNEMTLHRQFLKFCGFDLSTQESDQFRGMSWLSKHGMHGSAMPSGCPCKGPSGFRADAENLDRKRKVLCAFAAKVARVAHGLIKTGTD